MPELLGKITRYNNTGFEVVLQQPHGQLTRIRCSYNLWTNVKKHHNVGDIVQCDYTLVGEDEMKVARSFVKRNDMEVHFR